MILIAIALTIAFNLPKETPVIKEEENITTTIYDETNISAEQNISENKTPVSTLDFSKEIQEISDSIELPIEEDEITIEIPELPEQPEFPEWSEDWEPW